MDRAFFVRYFHSSWLSLLLVFGLNVVPSQAAEPGRGATADLERSYLESIIDHHFGALRITELAAGTAQAHPGAIDPADRVRPTPGFEPTEPRAAMDEIKSIARRNNRMQREEILAAQRFLREWYGVTHEPQLPAMAQTDIERLSAVSGEAFDRLFLEIFPQHHYLAATSSLNCLVGRELRHDDLRRYCQGIVDAQVGDIDEMRHLACRRFGVCDSQPQAQAMSPARRR